MLKCGYTRTTGNFGGCSLDEGVWSIHRGHNIPYGLARVSRGVLHRLVHYPLFALCHECTPAEPGRELSTKNSLFFKLLFFVKLRLKLLSIVQKPTEPVLRAAIL